MKIRVFESPSVLELAEEMQDGGSVKPRKMFRGGVGYGNFELPENLQELIGYAPDKKITTEQPQTAQEVRAAIPPKPKRSDSKYQFGAFQGKKGMDAYNRDLYSWEEQYGRFPTTEGAAEWLYGDQDPYYDTTSTTEETTTETAPTEEVTVQTIQEMIEEGSPGRTLILLPTPRVPRRATYLRVH